MLQKLGQFALILLFLIVILQQFFLKQYVPYTLTVLGFIVVILWFYKAYELGLESVRGQFYAIVAVAFSFQSLGFAFSSVNQIVTLSFWGIISYTLARFFFFAATFRYIFYFQSLGYRLNLRRLLVVISLTALAIVVTLLIPNVVKIFLTLSPYILYILLDVGMVFIIIYNTLLLWGSDLARRWAIGQAVILSLLLGDALFIAQAPYWGSVTLWGLATTLMGMIATIKG